MFLLPEEERGMDKSQIVIDFVRTGAPGTLANGTKYMRLMVASATFDDISINGAPEDIVNNDVTVFGKNVKCYFVDNVSSYE